MNITSFCFAKSRERSYRYKVFLKNDIKTAKTVKKITNKY